MEACFNITSALGRRPRYRSHFPNEKTGPERLSDWFKVAPPGAAEPEENNREKRPPLSDHPEGRRVSLGLKSPPGCEGVLEGSWGHCAGGPKSPSLAHLPDVFPPGSWCPLSAETTHACPRPGVISERPHFLSLGLREGSPEKATFNGRSGG